jgi:hypothetical protein
MPDRRIYKRIFAFILPIFLVVFIWPGFSAAESGVPYTVKQYEISVVTEKDGSALIQEKIEYLMHEDRRDYFYRYNYGDNNGIQLQGIIISDQTAGRAASYNIEALPVEPLSQPVQPMTYEQVDDGRRLEIRLHVFSQKDTVRTVQITYRLEALVILHQDAAVLNHTFFDTGILGRIERPTLSLDLPDNASVNQIWNMPVSLANFSVEQPVMSRLVFRGAQLDDHDQMTLIALFPQNLYPDAPLAAVALSREQLIQKADEYAQEQKEQSQLRELLFKLVFLLLGLSILIAILIYMVYDHEAPALYQLKTSQDIPDYAPPATIAMLLRHKRPARLILATLFDLLRRGALKRDGYVFIRNRAVEEPYVGFRAYEIFLISWLFEHVAEGDHFSISELRKYARESGSGSDFKSYFQQFRVLLEESVSEFYLVDQVKTRRGRMICQILSLAYLAAAVVLAVTSAQQAWFLLIPAAGYLVYSLRLRRLSRHGCELYAKARSLQRAMKKPQRLDPLPNPGFFTDTLPLAIALGSSHSLLRSIPEVLQTNRPDDVSAILADYSIGETGRWTERIEHLQNDLEVMESLISASILLAGSFHL